MKIKYIIISTLIIASIGGVLFFADELNRAAILGHRGEIETGQVFKLKVGMSKTESFMILEEYRMHRVQTTAARQCLGRKYNKHEELVVWSDDSWRRGTICLGLENDQLTSVTWLFNPLLP